MVYDDIINQKIQINKDKLYMTSSLRNDLNFYIYSLMANEDLVRLIKKQIQPSSLYQKDIIQTRAHLQFSQKQAQRLNAQRFALGHQLTRKLSNPQMTFRYLDYSVPTLGFFLNAGAFLSTIEMLGDEQQVKHWQNQVLNGRAVGGYGQTEVGHGSDVKGLQTLAIFNQKTQTWTIKSPTITSAKLWPGLLGQYSTHQVVQAKAIVKGKNIGNQTFVLEIRNGKLQDLPSVQAFDLGPKLGFQKVDNGGIIFKDHVAPRDAMLMKYVKVLKDGTVEGLQNTSALKYSYGSMLNLRVKLTYSFGFSAVIMPTISLYQVLKASDLQKDPNNRKFLTDNLCLGYGILLSNINNATLFNVFMTQIANKNFTKADKLLISVHIASATFKAISSRLSIDAASSMLTYSDITKFKTTSLPAHFANYVPCATYEGDNIVLLQQTAKFLLFKTDVTKEFKNVKKTFKSNDWQTAVAALQYIIVQRLISVKKRIQAHGANNLQFNSIWNEKEQISLIKIASLWGYMMFLRNLSLVLPGITKHQGFYRKICEGFTNFIINKIINDFDIQGFIVEQVETWKAFTDEQFLAMVELNTPIERVAEPMRYIPRQEGKWLSAKL